MRTIAGTTWSVEDAQAYILARVKAADSGCWLWGRAVVNGGYGRLRVPMRTTSGRLDRLAHRLAYEAFLGQIPDDLLVCHRCDVPACCNPAHLWLGTTKDNSDDRDSKGRLPSRAGANNGNAKLTEHEVVVIRQHLAQGRTCVALAAEYGLSSRAIINIGLRRSWAHLPG